MHPESLPLDWPSQSFPPCPFPPSLFSLVHCPPNLHPLIPPPPNLCPFVIPLPITAPCLSSFILFPPLIHPLSLPHPIPHLYPCPAPPKHRTRWPPCQETTRMTSAVGHSSWSQTSVLGSEMPTPVTGAKSSTTFGSEAIPGAQMQVSTPSHVGQPPASTIGRIFRDLEQPCSASCALWSQSLLRVLLPSCLLLIPLTSNLRRKSYVVHLTHGLLSFALWASYPPSPPPLHCCTHPLQMSLCISHSA